LNNRRLTRSGKQQLWRFQQLQGHALLISMDLREGVTHRDQRPTIPSPNDYASPATPLTHVFPADMSALGSVVRSV